MASFTNPLTALDKMKKTKAQLYAGALKKILKDKFADGDTVPFSIILNHVYPSWDQKKSAKLPFFLLGDPKSTGDWKKFREGTTEEGKPQKDFLVTGMCTRSGTHLTLTLNKTKGVSKIPPKVMTNLVNVVKAASPGMTISTKEVEGEKTSDAAAAVGTTTDNKAPKKETNTSSTDKKEETPEVKGKPKVTEEQKEKLVQKYKKDKQEEAKKINEDFKELEKLFSDESIKEAMENVKNENRRTKSKDLATVKKLLETFSATEKLYKNTPKQVQKKFPKSIEKLRKSKKQLLMLAKAVKKKRISFTESFANKYYKQKFKRVPTEQEVQTVQKILTDSVKMNKKRRKKAPQKLLFKETYRTLSEKGVKDFNVKYVNKSLQEQMK